MLKTVIALAIAAGFASASFAETAAPAEPMKAEVSSTEAAPKPAHKSVKKVHKTKKSVKKAEEAAAPAEAPAQ